MDWEHFSPAQILQRKENELRRLRDAIEAAERELDFLRAPSAGQSYAGKVVLGPADKELWSRRWEAYPKWRQRQEEETVLQTEADVKKCIRDLQKEGKWTDRGILGSNYDPKRNKTHWDYLLEELEHRQQGAVHERSWRQSMGKTCARRVQQWHRSKESAEQKKAKDDEEHLRKVARTMARGVKKYWEDVEKLIEDRHKLIHDEKQNRLLMRKQQRIIANAEELTTELRADLEGDGDESEASSSSSVNTADMEEEDNEETLEQEELLAREEGETYEGEVEDLKRLAEMDLDELRAKLAEMEEAEDTDTAAGAETNHVAAGPSGSGKGPPEKKDGQNGKVIDERSMNDLIDDLKKSQPGGVDLSTAKVKVKVPFLMNPAYTLREYQLIGLDWLNTMYHKGLNGILADEMGLGKTVMTIAMLANLACTKECWGPHLIVVPTSVLLNWEIEFKRFCPSFKVLTYHGSRQYRNSLRCGWSAENRFHVCITSYNLILSDAPMFRRKKWVYMILDEAQYIKNWKSKKWETLLNFNTERRLLLTGTPLQNNLMEMWSLLHFLMPDAVAFESNLEFRAWFSNPMQEMVTGQSTLNEHLIHRLHSLLRPFILRRLKKDVEKQLPKKYHHVLSCKLSKRQRVLYDDFMSLATTKDAISEGSYTGLIAILMSLRKVCNHPDLFEERPITSPFDQLEPIDLRVPRLACKPMEHMDDRLRMLRWLHTELLDTWSVSAIAERCERPTVISEAMRLPPEEDVAQLHPTHLFGPYSTALCARRAKLQEERATLIAHMNAVRCTIHNLGITGNLVRGCQRLADLRSSPRLALLHASDCFEPCGSTLMRTLVTTSEERMGNHLELLKKFTCFIAAARARPLTISAYLPIHYRPQKFRALRMEDVPHFDLRTLAPYRPTFVRLQMSFPDKYLLQYDCGKLQVLARLLAKLKAEGSRVLIFTQMSKMLDVLETFLCMGGHTYVRLDGSTKLEDRQFLMERFNHDDRIFVFILSTRSGGLGINLTGANCVVFYDSDWNPAMDLQAQDRCHRIGQTRDVHIYRLISEHTIEENIYKKVQEKKMMVNLTLKGGQFGADFVANKVNVRDFFHSFDEDMDQDEIRKLQLLAGENVEEVDAPVPKIVEVEGAAEVLTEELPPLPSAMSFEVDKDVEVAMIKAEDEDDRIAFKKAKEESSKELKEFDENFQFKDLDPVDAEVLEEEFMAKLRPLVRRSIDAYVDLYPDKAAEIAQEYRVEEYEALVADGNPGPLTTTSPTPTPASNPHPAAAGQLGEAPADAGSLPCGDGPGLSQPSALPRVNGSCPPEVAGGSATGKAGRPKRANDHPDPPAKRSRVEHPNELGEEPEGGGSSPLDDLPPPRFARTVVRSYPSGVHVLVKLPVPPPKVRTGGTPCGLGRRLPVAEEAEEDDDEDDNEVALFYETEHADDVLAQYRGIQFDLDDADLEHFYLHCLQKDQDRLERERQLREYLRADASESDAASEASLATKEDPGAGLAESAPRLADAEEAVSSDPRPSRRPVRSTATSFTGFGPDTEDGLDQESSLDAIPRRRPQRRVSRIDEPIIPVAPLRRGNQEECLQLLQEDNSELPWRDWEEAALLKAVETFAPLPAGQVLPTGASAVLPPPPRAASPAASSHGWSWDLLCDVVNAIGFPSATPRVAAQCKNRHAQIMTGHAPLPAGPPRQRPRLVDQPLGAIQKELKRRQLHHMAAVLAQPPGRAPKVLQKNRRKGPEGYPFSDTEADGGTARWSPVPGPGPPGPPPTGCPELRGHTPKDLLRVIAEKQRQPPEVAVVPQPSYLSRQPKGSPIPGSSAFPPQAAPYGFTAAPPGPRVVPPLHAVGGALSVMSQPPTSPLPNGDPLPLDGGPKGSAVPAAWELPPLGAMQVGPFPVQAAGSDPSTMLAALPSGHHLPPLSFPGFPPPTMSVSPSATNAGPTASTVHQPPHTTALLQPPHHHMPTLFLTNDHTARLSSNPSHLSAHAPLGPMALGSGPLAVHNGFAALQGSMGGLAPPPFPQFQQQLSSTPHPMMALATMHPRHLHLQQQFQQQRLTMATQQLQPPTGQLSLDMTVHPGMGTGTTFL